MQQPAVIGDKAPCVHGPNITAKERKNSSRQYALNAHSFRERETNQRHEALRSCDRPVQGSGRSKLRGKRELQMGMGEPSGEEEGRMREGCTKLTLNAKCNITNGFCRLNRLRCKRQVDDIGFSLLRRFWVWVS
jgi:hypothetical protein